MLRLKSSAAGGGGGEMANSMNWKRGLFRLWVVSSTAWVVSIFIAADAPEKINYAWRYYTDYSRLQKEQAVRSETGGNPYLDILNRDEAMWADAAEATHANQAVQTSNAKLRASDIMLDKMVAQREAKLRELDRSPPMVKRRFTDSDFAELSAPEKPDWWWLAAMLLPPTLGVALAWVFLLGIFKTGRWIWLGFKHG